MKVQNNNSVQDQSGNSHNHMLSGVFIYENESLVDLENEEWIDAIGFDGIYQVSNLGRVKSIERMCIRNNGRNFLLKEKIRKQQVSEKFSSIRVGCCENGFMTNVIVARLVFFSFNYNIKNLPEYSVMHKDNDWKNNKLENLKIGTQNEISKLTFEHGKVEHLKLGNPMLSKHKIENSVLENMVIKKLKCLCCGEIKDISLFREGRNKCKKCSINSKLTKENRIKRFEKSIFKTVDIKTKKEIIYSDAKKEDLLKIISIVTVFKYSKSGKVCYPSPKSRFQFSPFRIEVLKT